MTQIDHIGFPVTDFDRSVAFYTAALKPLGITAIMNFEYEGERHAGFGDGQPYFWIGTGKAAAKTCHVAFRVAKRADVNAFYDAALAAGGTDNGKPGVREMYNPTYYAAFVLDPDGNNIEAVCHDPE